MILPPEPMITTFNFELYGWWVVGGDGVTQSLVVDFMERQIHIF